MSASAITAGLAPMRAIRDLIAACEATFGDDNGEQVLLANAREGVLILQNILGDDQSNEPAALAPIGAGDRSIEDRLGEALRREHHGLIMPLWENLPDEQRAAWRDRTRSFRTILESVGLKLPEDAT